MAYTPAQVAPTNKYSAFDLTLKDTSVSPNKTVGLILCDRKGNRKRNMIEAGNPPTTLRITQGQGGYSDFELPYSTFEQSDFSGGRGLAEFEKDRSRYYDANRIDAFRGNLILPGKVTTCTGYGTSYTIPGYDHITSYAYAGVTDQNHLASKITPTANITIRYISFYGYTTTRASVMAAIYNNSAGAPSTPVQAVNLSIAASNALAPITIPVNATLAGGTTYWVVVNIVGDPDAGTAYIAYDDNVSGNSVLYNEFVSPSYVTRFSNAAISYTVADHHLGQVRFFEYKGALYKVTQPDDFTAPRLFCTDYCGAAKANTGHLEYIDTGVTLAVNAWAGLTIKVTAGPGSTEESPYRTITSNATDGKCYVDKPWNITHTTATEWVVMGTDYWWEITGHGLTKPVTSVCVVNDIVYFAQGRGTNIRRFNAYNNSGTWTNRFADDGANNCDFLCLVPDSTGVKKVWAASRVTCGVASASPTTITDWTSNNLTYAADIVCGSTNAKITGLIPYGDPMIPYVLKEDGFGSIANGVYAESPISGEMAAVLSELNGRANCRHGVYLYFSFGEGLERYYQQRLDDVGPNRDEGFPTNRRGPVYAMVPYPGRIFASVDGGTAGYSSILAVNPDNRGYHEIYRGALGKRIRSLHIQSIPGKQYQRLWFSEEEDIKWLPVALNPLKTTGYTFQDATACTLITSWIYTDYPAVIKYWDSITVWAENLDTTHQYVSVSYQTDTEDVADTWHALAANFTTSPAQTQDLSTAHDVKGKRIRFKITLYSDSSTETPEVKRIVVNGITRISPKYNKSIMFYLEDYGEDLLNVHDDRTAKTKLDELRTWADSDNTPCPLELHFAHTDVWDDQLVFIEPGSVSLLESTEKEGTKNVKLICQMTLRGL